MAPEVLKGSEYNEKIDQYSFAICMLIFSASFFYIYLYFLLQIFFVGLWEALTNLIPFDELSIPQLTRAVTVCLCTFF
jgi:serine/threonine protein kinase